MASLQRSALRILSTRVGAAAHNQLRVSQRRHISTLIPQRQRAAHSPAASFVRWHSAPTATSKVYDFEQIKELSAAPSKERILIDVREPNEYEAGYIPSAINLPIKSQPDAIFLPEEEFEDRFGFSKPAKDAEVIFYCRSGVRSSAAAQLAQQHGYTNVAEYRGSWLDWEKNGGPSGQDLP